MTPAWVEAPGGYAVALDGRRIVARSPRGVTLKAVPAALRTAPVIEQLRDLRDWLTQHEIECAESVESWMLRSQPLPGAMLAVIWRDPAWRQALCNAVVRAGDATGFLLGTDAARGIGLVTLDGETTWLANATVVIAHPQGLTELTEFREFATELDLEQGIGQLYREAWPAAEPALSDVAFVVRRFTHLALGDRLIVCIDSQPPDGLGVDQV
jgi:hypothetical protein